MPKSSLTLVYLTLALILIFLLLPNNSSDSSKLPGVEILEPIAPKGYVCYRASGPIQVDGKLDEPAWKAAPWTDAFVDIEGDLKPFPRHHTRVKLVWDDEYLYVAAELEEPHLWATLKEHDAIIFQDNDFEMFLDPDGDSHAYGELEINALNTTWDLFLTKPYKNGGRALHDWEIHGLKTAVHLDGTLNDPSDRDRGWTIEIAWPMRNIKEFSLGNVPPKVGEQWRINFSRVQWDLALDQKNYQKIPDKREYNWVWSPQGVIDMHRPERWGYLQFADRTPTEFQPDPTLAARDALHRIYYAQRDYREKEKRWAKNLEQLKLNRLFHPDFQNLFMTVTATNFEVTVESKNRNGQPVKLRIDSDARITQHQP